MASSTGSVVIQKRKLKVNKINNEWLRGYLYINTKKQHRLKLQSSLKNTQNIRFSACHLLGDYFESIKKDFEKASKVYRSNCDDYGYARSCLKYGNYSFLGKGKTGSGGSVSEAYKYYEKGCSLNEPDSCLHSGLILVSRSMKQEMNRDVKKVCECDMVNR